MSKLKEALSLMEETFSSNELIKKAVLLGYKMNRHNEEIVNTFLKLNCTQLNTSRMWTKKEFKNPMKLNDTTCIDYLKAKGFKVYKPVIEYKEL